jgi:surface antigen
MKKIIIIPIVTALMATGCATTGSTGKGLLGAGAGFGACKLLGGSNTECAIAAAAAGAATYLISEKLDERDRKSYAEAQAKAASTGQAVTVVSPETQNEISFTPTSTFVNAQGQTCRKFDATYTRDGQEFPAEETHCEISTGNWQMVEA